MEKNFSPQARAKLKKETDAFERWKESNPRGLSHADVGIVPTSFSGHERNHIFFNFPDANFEDLSGLSGLDSIKDSRVFSLLDFDRDGWLDIAMVNANYPLLNVFRNRLGDLHARNRIRRNVIAIRLVGGNHSSKPNTQYASRDGFGAVVKLRAGDLQLMREHRCGDGMAAQNSNTILIGIGDNELAENLTVIWPSGVPQKFENLKAGILITVYENPQQSPDKQTATFESYLKNISVKNVTAAIKPISSQRLDFAEFAEISSSAKMRIFTSTATWCDACKRKLPQLEAIRKTFSKDDRDDVDLLGVPIDSDDLMDRSRKLKQYEDVNHPAYKIMFDLSESTREKFVKLKIDLVGDDVEPSTIVTDRQGVIYYASPGVPDISTLKRILEHLRARQ